MSAAGEQLCAVEPELGPVVVVERGVEDVWVLEYAEVELQ